MLKNVDLIEKLIIRALIIMLLLVLVLGTCDLVRVLVADILRPPIILLDISTVFDTFGEVLIILIGMELLKSMKLFLTEEKIKPELVIEVAMIALCNKVITLDITHLPGTISLGIAALLIGLSMSYFVLRRMSTIRALQVRRINKVGSSPSEQEHKGK